MQQVLFSSSNVFHRTLITMNNMTTPEHACIVAQSGWRATLCAVTTTITFLVKGLNGVGWLLPIEVAFDPRASG